MIHLNTFYISDTLTFFIIIKPNISADLLRRSRGGSKAHSGTSKSSNSRWSLKIQRPDIKIKDNVVVKKITTKAMAFCRYYNITHLLITRLFYGCLCSDLSCLSRRWAFYYYYFSQNIVSEFFITHLL